MSRRRGGGMTRRRAVIVGGLIAFAGMGCTPSTLGFLFRGDGKQPPEYPLPAKDGKKEVTVAILVTSAPTLGLDFAGADRELVGLIGKRLADETKEAKAKIKAVPAAKVEKAKTSGGADWRTVNPAALGKQVGADYVLDVTITSMTMFQPEYGREFCKGRATLNVVVYDTAKPDQPLQEYVHNSLQPEQDVTTKPPEHYRRWFVEQLATEVAWRHVPHEANLNNMAQRH